ncbi:MAG: hypothetical protein ACOVN5_08560 [Aquidulcibacter sp.]
MAHLWEIKHPYYISEAPDAHQYWKTWGEFIADEADADMDYNLVYRFDWLEGSGWDLGDYNGDDYYRHAELWIGFVSQRKAFCRTACIAVCRADEHAIIEYLKPRLAHLLELWVPLEPETPPHA